MFDNATRKLQVLCKINVLIFTLICAFLGWTIGDSIDPFEGTILGTIIGVCFGFWVSYMVSLFICSFLEMCKNVSELNTKIK